MNGFRAWLDRQGGMLVAPRRTVAALDSDDGRRDGTWALLAWLLAVHVYDVFGIVARIAALRFDAVIGALAELAFSLLPPFVATFAIELTLGRERAYRAGSCLAPMLALGALLQLAQSVGWWLASPGWVTDVVAGVCAVGLALWVRPAVPMRAGDVR